jgi:hypothetical protein
MRVTLNKKAYDFAIQMIHEKKFDDKRGSGEVARAKPSNEQEEQFLKSHSWEEFGAWYLGAHYDRPENTRNRYEFPIGDFNVVHRSDLLEIQKRAHSDHYDDIAKAAQELVDLIDKKTKK